MNAKSTKRKRKKTADAVEILYNRYYRGKPDRIAALQGEYLNSRIARAIYDLRKSTGLTQAQFAELLDTKASAISRLEDADYGGHSLSLLRKIASLYMGRIEIRIVPEKKSQKYLISPKTKTPMKNCVEIIA